MKISEEHADLRVRRTHKLLWEALMAELSERPFEEVTVKDICERAMVHRTTFYKHYEDKYALLEQGMRQMYEALLAEGHRPPGAFSLNDPPPYFIRLFEHVAQHQHFYKLMLCGEGIGRFQELIKKYVAEVALVKLHKLAPANESFTFPLAMQVQCFAGAVLSLLAWWLENDMPLSPHHMAQYLLSFHNTLFAHH
ncbi:TetR/AcrR family transcriptional regulator [Ktedonospora formicarum]|uniref:TetR family transcriptional regulator n=1 Tax=Ktedonospora formicarum TaxID=2778364 RepID=A0A8J3MWN5_9CHLR|nr:TetR/AcrR family transcriptional regulator C-terminal domain-containing protein [Ktedonospora formicarum]GHO47780.1 TetR family transcriptional regulator [Ktedonospora formicarum]